MFKRGCHVSTTWVAILPVFFTGSQHSAWYRRHSTNKHLLKEDDKSETGWGTGKGLFRAKRLFSWPLKN